MIFKVDVDAAQNEEGREDTFMTKVTFKGTSTELISAAATLCARIFAEHPVEHEMFCRYYPQIHMGGGDDGDGSKDENEEQ